MMRVHVICEGLTEEIFVNEVLSDFFNPKGIYLYPSLVGKPGHKGCNLKLERLLTDLRGRLLSDQNAYCTTFFDFYGLAPDFPGKVEAIEKASSTEKSACVLNAFSNVLRIKLGETPLHRFIPYVQMYEFEGLLFSDPIAFAQGINQKRLINAFQEIRNKFKSPEEINDSSDTAPSKRIKALFSEYDKPVHGSLAALQIGLSVIRQECPLFDGWLKRIEALQ
ncbi:MAG: DUF4276 family protein [Candidatus Brocadiae bacterium]|nr:DUF4276 family protein [Candidatus Brocadiia bacterium]